MERNKIYIGAVFVVIVIIGLMLFVRSGRNNIKEEPIEEGVIDSNEEEVAKDMYIFSGPTWQWYKTEMKDGTTKSPNVNKEDKFSLRFDSEKGMLMVASDCNNSSAIYTSGAANTLEFGEFVSTMMYCEESQEEEFLQMVKNSFRYFFTLSGDLVMVLKNEDGMIFLKKQAIGL